MVKAPRRSRAFPAESEDFETDSYVHGQTLPASYDEDAYTQWFCAFLRSDLPSLTAGQQLGMRADLWRFVHPEIVTRTWSEGEYLPPAAILGDLQKVARDGIDAVRSGKWFSLERGIGYGIALFGDRLFRGSRTGSLDDQFRAVVMDTLQANWTRLAACPQCREMFLKLGKQKYCSPKCASRARSDTFKARRKERDHHHEYVRRIQKKTGVKLKINPRGTK